MERRFRSAWTIPSTSAGSFMLNKTMWRITRVSPFDASAGVASGSLHHHPAGDVDSLPGHLARIIGCEEESDLRNVFWFLESAHGDACEPTLLDRLLGLAGHRRFPGVLPLHHVGVPAPRADTVASHMRSDLECDSLAEHDDRCLRRTVVREELVSTLARLGSDVDDRPRTAF